MCIRYSRSHKSTTIFFHLMHWCLYILLLFTVTLVMESPHGATPTNVTCHPFNILKIKLYVLSTLALFTQMRRFCYMNITSYAKRKCFIIIYHFCFSSWLVLICQLVLLIHPSCLTPTPPGLPLIEIFYCLLLILITESKRHTSLLFHSGIPYHQLSNPLRTCLPLKDLLKSSF